MGACFCRVVLAYLAEDLSWDALLPLSQVLEPSLLQPDDAQLPGDPLMFILLHFGKGKADVQSLTDECWKAPLLAHVPFSFERALENSLVYIKNKQHLLDVARGGGGGKLGRPPQVQPSPATVPVWGGRSWTEQVPCLEMGSQQITENTQLFWKTRPHGHRAARDCERNKQL